MTNTPNTGYYMPDYAYFDFLEERGWDVEELKECEDWCYPYGYRVAWQILQANGSKSISPYDNQGVTWWAESDNGCGMDSGDGPSDEGGAGMIRVWAMYD